MKEKTIFSALSGPGEKKKFSAPDISIKEFDLGRVIMISNPGNGLDNDLDWDESWNS